MAKIKDEEQEEEVLSSEDQINAYLKANKDDHYNFEDSIDYKVTTGSLLLDMELGGGIRPSVLRASGVSEGGKTSLGLALAKNFQDKINDSKVVYIKSEGRLGPEIIMRAGVNTSPEKWFVFATNIYETAISLMRDLVKNNPTKRRYFFIIDSMDSLVPKGDIDRPFEDANKVAGGALLTSDFLRKMALALSSRGHLCYIVSQVRSTVTINPYQKTDPKLTNASGGNALLHYSDWILEFQQRFNKDIIWAGEEGKSERLGHYCKIIFRKSINEKTGREIKYPIKYGRKNGTSVWTELECIDMLLAWQLLNRKGEKGSWYYFDSTILGELKKLDIDFPEKIQGLDNLTLILEKQPLITNHLVEKFRTVLLNS